MNDLKFALRRLPKRLDFMVRPAPRRCGGQTVEVFELGRRHSFLFEDSPGP